MGALVRFTTGVILLPFCVAVTITLGDMLRLLLPESVVKAPASVIGLAMGFALWIFLYFVMPRPVRSYVLAHELTHALWGWFMGARIRKLKVSAKGGSVSLSKTNILIELAPYFFPFYTMLVILAYGLVSLFFDPTLYEPLWLGAVGLTWGFHLTFTISALFENQPDIHLNGRLFSYVLIYAMNLFGVCIWIIVVATPTWAWFATQLTAVSAQIYGTLLDYLIRAGSFVAAKLR